MALLSVVLAVVLSSMDIAFADEPRDAITARIIGGSTVATEYPWMASLQRRKDEGYGHICGAVLVGPRAVVTAAHCVDDVGASDLRLVIGVRDWTSSNPENRYQVINRVVHPEFNAVTLVNDVAVLMTDRVVTGLTPIVLPEPHGMGETVDQAMTLDDVGGEVLLPGIYDTTFLPEPDISYRILGWGLTDPVINDIPFELQEATLQVFDRAYCQEAVSFMPSTSFCAGLRDGTVDRCLGDSGGPLIRIRPLDPNDETDVLSQRITLMGLVSFGSVSHCATPNHPGYYTDVSQFLPFIHGVASDRDLWIPMGWWGVGVPFESRVTLSNGSLNGYQFDQFTGEYPDGVVLNSETCDQTILDAGDACEFVYRYTPTTVGRIVQKTAITHLARDPETNDIVTQEKQLIAIGTGLAATDVHEAFALPGTSWFTGGDASWSPAFDAYAAGVAAMRSGEITDNATSVLQGFLPGPNQIDAYVLVETETGFDELTITMNGEVLESFSGLLSDWLTVPLTVPPEGAVVQFSYTKDSSNSYWRDAVWVDFQSPLPLASEPRDVGEGDNVERLVFVTGEGSLGETARLQTAEGGASGGGLGVPSILLLVLALPLLACATHNNQKNNQNNNKNEENAITRPLNQELGQVPTELPTEQGKAQTGLVEEPLYGKSYRDGALTIQVRTFGCTTAKHFLVMPSVDRPGWLTVWRTRPDYCRRAPMITSVTLTVPERLRAELRAQGFEASLRLTNVEVPTAGLPVIPPVVNP
ncbi:MAG: serine protease [Gammaproteobacteria bacterium]